jgi:formate dehydrogenase gamma subunit
VSAATPIPLTIPRRAQLRRLALVALAAVATIATSTSPAAAQESCSDCHETEIPDFSIHAGFSCGDCHSGYDEDVHPEEMVVGEMICAECHADAAEDFARSVHGENRKQNGSESAWPEEHSCSVCHGVHDARAVDDPESRVFFRNVAQTCGECHGDIGIVQAFGLSTAPFENFQHSVHGMARDDLDARPATCADCHRAHLVLRASDSESLINPFRIPDTCGACHDTEAADYTSSVHGVAFGRGVSAAPNCTDCHGIHSIKMVHQEEASPLEQRLVRTTCVSCHASEALMSEYGVAPARVRTYQATYHGLALKRGTTAVADCASCHGIHAIYPSSDPRSSVAAANLEETCGGCHPGAGAEFTKNPVHFAVGGEPTLDVVITEWVKRLYWTLILVVLGGMLVHNAVIMSFYVRRKARRDERGSELPRFTRSQVIQHGVLVVTFVLLAITGFVIAYPEMWWSELLEALGLTEPIRRWTHRIAAIGLLGAGTYHVLWLWLTPYGRAELRRILPRLQDMRDVIQNMLFHLRRSDRLPAPGKYDYPAKLEYWSLVWGTVIMAVTGVILWFPVWATSFLPYWSVKVSEVIHLFEAWLATLAILFFHFFFVLGHPDVYPVSLAMWHGRMPEGEARHRHPEWVAELEAADKDAEGRMATARKATEPPTEKPKHEENEA